MQVTTDRNNARVFRQKIGEALNASPIYFDCLGIKKELIKGLHRALDPR